MKKGLFSVFILLVAVAALAVFPTTAAAEETSGTCGKNLTWIFEDGILTITGSGDMDAFVYDELVPWHHLKASITAVNLPSGIKTIGHKAFAGCSLLETIVIPDGVTSIRDYAFANCSGLTSISIPDSVMTIGYFAFGGCSGITSLDIPEGMKVIGN